MDITRLGRISLIIGVVVLAITLWWWADHYIPVAEYHARHRLGGSSLVSYLPCLLSESDRGCDFHTGLWGGHMDRPPIVLFWVGAVFTLLGVAMAFAAKQPEGK